MYLWNQDEICSSFDLDEGFINSDIGTNSNSDWNYSSILGAEI